MTTITDDDVARQWQVWLGYRASIWSHRGYVVRGETVYTSSRRDADAVVSRTESDE